MFSAPARKLQYPLDRISQLTVTTPAGQEVCGLPEFPEDSDEQITVLFRLSLNEFVVLASAIDAGSDMAYGDDGQKVWWLWIASVMCAAFCEEMAKCLLEENPAVVEALSQLIINNTTVQNAIGQAISSIGSSVPGQPLSNDQAGQNILPTENFPPGEPCDLDSLWGACLFLVQMGNRAITDFFEQVENATNAIETSGIVAQAIPAAGPYAAAAAEFADQLYENLQEGYAGSYTETYEQSLACALFCLARKGCELTPEMLIQAMEVRLGYVDGTENFGVLMARIGTGVFIGDGIADSAFYIYFSALRFGQQFGNQFGIRPLTDMLSLGADQLASDNWEILCDCPIECDDFDFRISPFSPQWLIRDAMTSSPLSQYSSGVGYIARAQLAGGFQNQIFTISSFGCETLEYTYTAVNLPSQVALFWCNSDFSVLTLAINLTYGTGTVTDTVDLSALTPPPGATGFLLVSGDALDIDNVVTWQQANFS